MLASHAGRTNADSDAACLHEPIPTTILKDVTDIGSKCKYIVSKSAGSEEGGDLWGPLFIILGFALFLWIQAPLPQKRAVFGMGFMLPWVGALIVYLNASFLGSNVSLFQTVSVVGYSILPLALLSFVSLVIPTSLQAIKIILVAGAIFLSQRVSFAYLRPSVKSEKQWLVAYPLGVYYLLLGWIVVIL